MKVVKNQSVRPLVKANLLDKAVSLFSPSAGLSRLKSKAQLQYLSDSGYLVAGGNRKTLRGWQAPENTADRDILPVLSRARASSRDLFMNTAIGSGGLRRIVANAIGPGLRLQCRIDRNFLKLEEKEAAAWERNTEREFNLYAKSKECDLKRSLNFYQMQKLILLSTLMNGDSFFALPYKDTRNFPYKLKIQLIEADDVFNSNGTPDCTKMAGGIEVDNNGAPSKIYVRKKTDVYNNTLFINPYLSESIPVNIYSASGRKNIYHVYDPERINQRRAMPYMAPIFEKVKQISRLSDAELMKNIISAFFTITITSVSEASALSDPFLASQSVLDTATNPQDAKMYEMGSGNFLQLDPDEKAEIIESKTQSGSEFVPFFESMLKEIGMSIGIPFEVLLLQFNSSYTASQASLQEAWKLFIDKRNFTANEFCQPIYKEWLIEAITKGRIKAPGFFNDYSIQEAWCCSTWEGAKKAVLDPLKEAKASEVRLKNNLTCHENEFIAAGNEDWEGMIDRKAREKAYLDEKDLSDSSNEQDLLVNNLLSNDEGNQGK